MSDAMPGIAAPATTTSAAPETTSPAPEPKLTQTNGSQPKPEPTKQAAPPSQEMREYKINGKMVRMTQQEADDYVSMSYAAQQKFTEAAEIRKKHESKESEYKKNRIQAFLDYTQDLSPEERREVLEKYYAEQYIEPETLTAEQRQLKELQAFKAQKEAEETERTERERTENEKKMTEAQKTRLQEEIVQAMEQSGLPKTKFFVQRVAFYMRQNLVNGWEAPTETIIRQVKSERKSIMSDMTDESTPEQLIDLLGSNVIDKLMKYKIEQIRNGRREKQTPFQGNGANKFNIETEKTDYNEVNRRLRDMRSGRFVQKN